MFFYYEVILESMFDLGLYLGLIPESYSTPDCEYLNVLGTRGATSLGIGLCLGLIPMSDSFLYRQLSFYLYIHLL